MTEEEIEREHKENLALFKKLVEANKWTFAKTMAAIPHWWLARKAVDTGQFSWMVSMIYAYGVPEKFFSKTYKYLYIGEYKYWCMGNPVAETRIINRARINNP